MSEQIGAATIPERGATPDDEVGSRPGEDDPVIRMLEEWLADESGYDEAAWPELKEAVDRERERIGARTLFRG